MSSVYRVEIPVKDHGRPDVVEAKEKEMDNLRGYDTWSEVPFTGQDLVGLKWVITASENHDGQKQKVKGRLVCKGYEEEFKPQSDSPTIGRSNLLVFTAVAANCRFHIWTIDIKGAYLQSNKLDRDIFVKPPPDVQKTLEDGTVWKLNKPMYGLDDSGRKFYLKVKEILLGMNFAEMNEDNAFFFMRKNGELIAMISSHVDDFKIASTNDFGQQIIDNIAKHLTISKVEKDSFRFTGVDFKRTEESITMSMEAYAASITPIEHFRECKKDEELTKTEHKLFRKKVGQLSWLANNARPDLSIQAQSLSQKNSKPTMGDLKRINHVVRLVHQNSNTIVFRYVDTKDNLRIYGISDASWSIKERPVSGVVYMLGSKRNTNVSPLTWKSRAIISPTKCVKDAETRSLSSNAEFSSKFARMVERLLFGDVQQRLEVKCFADNRPLLESIASTKPPVNSDMNDVIRYLKDKLAWGQVSSYNWLPTQKMVSDFLTKEMKIGDNVWNVFRKGTWEHGDTTWNNVTMKGLEFCLSNPTVKDNEG